MSVAPVSFVVPRGDPGVSIGGIGARAAVLTVQLGRPHLSKPAPQMLLDHLIADLSAHLGPILPKTSVCRDHRGNLKPIFYSTALTPELA
jgi:hypothetical protein